MEQIWPTMVSDAPPLTPPTHYILLLLLPDDRSCTVPGPIMKLVQKQNLEYLHMKTHYSISYYQFMKQLLILNYNFAKTQIDTTNPNEPMVSVLHVYRYYYYYYYYY